MKCGKRSEGNLGLFVGSLALWVTGCGLQTVAPVKEYVPVRVPTRLEWGDWGLALSSHYSKIENTGRANVDARKPLDRFLAMVSVVGPRKTPELFPQISDRLAYWINCYNATMLAARDRAKSHLERRYRFKIDGGWWTPAELRRRALSEAGADWRVRMTLSDPSRAGPPLYRRPFLGELLDGQLNDATQLALASTDVVNIDHGEQKRLLLWSGLYEIRERLVADFEQRTGAKGAGILNVLLETADLDRRAWLNSAIGYAVEVMPERAVAVAQGSPAM